VASRALGSLAGDLAPEVRTKLQELQKRSFSLQEFREYMCQVTVIDACPVWERVQIASWVLMVAIFLSLVAYGFAMAMDYHYHFHRARKSSRQAFKTLYAVAPLGILLGLVQYAVLASDVKHMAPSDKSNPLGPNLSKAAVLMVCSWIPWVAVYFFGSGNLAEVLNEEEATQRKYLRYAGLGHRDYGAAQPESAWSGPSWFGSAPRGAVVAWGHQPAVDIDTHLQEAGHSQAGFLPAPSGHAHAGFLPAPSAAGFHMPAGPSAVSFHGPGVSASPVPGRGVPAF